MVALTHKWRPERDERRIREDARLDQLKALLVPNMEQEQHDEEPALYVRDRIRVEQLRNRRTNQ